MAEIIRLQGLRDGEGMSVDEFLYHHRNMELYPGFVTDKPAPEPFWRCILRGLRIF